MLYEIQCHAEVLTRSQNLNGEMGKSEAPPELDSELWTMRVLMFRKPNHIKSRCSGHQKRKKKKKEVYSY